MFVCLSVSYISACKVSALKHEAGDDAMEGRALVSEAMLTGSELAEVLCGSWDDIVVELKHNAAGLLPCGGGKQDGMKIPKWGLWRGRG